MGYYIDSSGLVKRYIREQGTTWMIALAAAVTANDIYTVRISAAEVVSAIVRRTNDGSIAAADGLAAVAKFQSHLAAQYHILEVTPAVMDRAIALIQVHGLRGYDSVQLAAACEMNGLRTHMHLPPLTFISADMDLNAAATLEGLPVENPTLHP